jgi:uncharacterized protein (DUF433 family)
MALHGLKSCERHGKARPPGICGVAVPSEVSGAHSCNRIAGIADVYRRMLCLWMEDFSMAALDRITQQAGIMGGKPCIRGMRVTVGMIVSQIGAGRSIEAVLADYPYLEHEDVLQALRYAAWRAEEREIIIDR